MSGFIASTLDLDLIFQLKPPAVTDASGVIIKTLQQGGIVRDPLGLLVVLPTGLIRRIAGTPITFVDLADRYRKKNNNTYSIDTGFRTSNNSDLSTIFEWGGYVPSFETVTLTKTGRKASIVVGGNYYIVEISGTYVNNGISFVSRSGRVVNNPYNFSCETQALVFGVEFTFIVRIYNGFFQSVQERTEKITTFGLPKFTTITLVSVTATNLNFSFTGENYSKINHAITYSTGTVNGSTEILSSSSSIVNIPITNNTEIFNIIFTPYNEFDEDGQTTTKTITYAVETLENKTPTSSISQDTPEYLYKADFLIIGGGGSGGSGGSKVSDGRGGGGGGGGSGGYQIVSGQIFDGTKGRKSITYTCGASGNGVNGVSSGTSGRDGNNGNNGTSSSISVPLLSLLYTSTGGIGGQGGGRSGNPGVGGSGGSPGGFSGNSGDGGGSNSTNGGENGGGGLKGSYADATFAAAAYGEGSVGSGGASGGNSSNTTNGEGAVTRGVLYYVMIQ